MPMDVIDVDALEEDTIQPNGVIDSCDLEHAELLQPSINIQSQFNLYNNRHFSNRIINTTVEYSTRMTLCAGTCTFRPPNVRIALSEPLLKFRPRSDLLSTLLHEMIHAYLFLTQRISRDGADGHGPIFMSHARRINAAEPGIDITPYHDFGAEVDHYRVHHWCCQKCDHLIKRAMNRAPGPADQFWPSHQQNCGGQYIKIAGPPKKEKPVKPPKNRAVAVAAKGTEHVPKGVMKTFRIDDMLSGRLGKPTVKMSSCPVCAVSVKQDEMNKHLDLCLAEGMFTQPSNAPPAQPPMQPPGPPQQTKTARVETTYPTKPVATREPVPLPEDGIGPVPVTSTRHPNPQERKRTVNDSCQTGSQESYDVMQYIADPEALFNLALAPKKFPPEQVDKIFKNLPRCLPEPSHPLPKNGIKDFLQSLINPESPSCNEQQAKAIISPLRLGPSGEEFSFHAISERLSMTWSDILQLIQQNSSPDKHGNIIFSAKLIDMLSSPHPLNTSDESKIPCKRPRHNTHLVGEGENQLHNRKRGPEINRPGSRERNQKVGEYRNTRKKPNDNNVRQSGLEEHVSVCVAGSQGQEGDHTESKKVHPPVTHVAPTGSRESDMPCKKSQRCPICDVALSRQDLEAHVAKCMMSTGLADAF